ncbi:MAG: PDZ domain-containing protein [Rhodoferax sp.]|nr:PDZ domain-containing protein [Rhodoferax sp.]
MFLPGAQAQPVTPSPDHLQLYRSRDCAQLKTSGAELEELFKWNEAQWNQPGLPNLSAEDRAYEQRLRREGLAELGQKNAAARAALAMAIAEKQCDNPASGVAPSPAPRPPVVAGQLPQIGARVDTVSPGFAQSLGLRQATGALVIEAEAGGPAQKAGLQALDVIMEITGQQVQSPADLQESLGRMRSGFKAQLRVWRNKAMRDIVVTIADMPVAPAVAAPPPSLPSAAAFPQPVPQATPSAVLPPAGPPRFCYAFLVQIGKPGGVQSSLWEERGPDFSHTAMLLSMAGFAAHMRQVQPGIWHDDFPAGKCYPGSNQCVASSTRTFGTSQQISQFCHGTREQAEDARKRQGIGLPVIEWTPPAAP